MKCPRCQKIFRVPAPKPAAPVARLLLTCSSCELLVQVNMEQPGQAFRCPRCESSLPLPFGPAQPPRAPQQPVLTPKPQTAPEVPPTTDDSREAKSSTSTEPARWVVPHPSFRLGVALALGFLVLIGGILGAWSLFSHSPPPIREENVIGPGSGPTPPPDSQTAAAPSDLDFVSTDSLAILSIRLADLWNSPLLQKSLARMPAELQEQLKQEQQNHFDMADLERVTVVWKDPQGASLWAILKTTIPFNAAKRETLLAQSGVKWKEKPYQGVKYQLATAPLLPGAPGVPMALYIASDNVFVAGTESGVKLALDQMQGRGTTGELAALPPLIKSNKHQILLSGLPPQTPEMLGPQALQLPKSMRESLTPKTGVLKVDFGQTLKVELVNTYAGQPQAERARLALEMLKTANLQLQQKPGQPVPLEQKKFQDQLVKLLRALHVEVNNAELVVSTEIDLEKLVPNLPNEIGRTFDLAGRQGNGDENFKRLALAMKQYYDVHGSYPPAVKYSADGKKQLYSWRVLLLPYLGEEELYKKFELSEAWDSETNKPLVERMPRVFSHPRFLAIGPDAKAGKTCFQVLTGHKAPFTDKEEKKLTNADIADGLDQTILLVASQHLVPWTSPEDAPVPDDVNELAEGLLRSLRPTWGDTFSVALFDGTIHSVKRSIQSRTFLAAVTPAGGEMLPPDW